MFLLMTDARARLPGRVACALWLAAALVFPWPARAALTLDEAVAMAQRNDPWLAGSEFREQAVMAQGVAAGTLPDPVVSVGYANLPTDTFDTDQEAMTQFKVGVVQMIPRGDSRALSRKRLDRLAEQFPYQREERRAQLAVSVTNAWLEAYRARESIRLIEQDRELFEHLVDVAESSYAAALGRTRQQDLVRAQLEVTRLEDRLAVLHQRQETAVSRLGEWLRPARAEEQAHWQGLAFRGPELAGELPDIALVHPELYRPGAAAPPAELGRYLGTHPMIRSLDSRIDAGEVEVELAQQKYRPQWSVNASYGYREDDPTGGRARPDLFSVGVAFDLPLFTSRRQDQEVRSAVAEKEALRTEKMLALRRMLADFETQRARLLRIEQRRELYRGRLLQEMREQAEASLTAYTRDDGDFAEVVRARIAELNARIDALGIDIERLQTINQLNYFFAGTVAGGEGESS